MESHHSIIYCDPPSEGASSGEAVLGRCRTSRDSDDEVKTSICIHVKEKNYPNVSETEQKRLTLHDVQTGLPLAFRVLPGLHGGVAFDVNEGSVRKGQCA